MSKYYGERVLAFDLSRVLLKEREGHITKFEKKYNLKQGTLDDIFFSSIAHNFRIGITTEKEFWKSVKSDIENYYSIHPTIEISDLKDAWYGRYEVDKKLVKIIKKAKEKYLLILITGGNIGRIKYAKTNFEDSLKPFTVAISSSSLKCSKDEKEFWERVKRVNKIDPKKTLIFDNDYKYLRAASEAGFTGFWYEEGEKTDDYYEDLEHYILFGLDIHWPINRKMRN